MVRTTTWWFIARDLRPISVVSGVGFKRLVAWLEPGYTLPSATCVTKLVRAKFCEGRKRLIALLKDEVGISFTTDLGTSSRMHDYITITGHFVDDFWDLRSCVLTTKAFSGATYSGEHCEDPESGGGGVWHS